MSASRWRAWSLVQKFYKSVFSGTPCTWTTFWACYFGFYLPSSRFYSEVKPFCYLSCAFALKGWVEVRESKQGLRKYAVAVVLFISCVFSHRVYPTQCWSNTQPTSPSFSWTTISNQQRGWVGLQKDLLCLGCSKHSDISFFWIPVAFSPTINF